MIEIDKKYKKLVQSIAKEYNLEIVYSIGKHYNKDYHVLEMNTKNVDDIPYTTLTFSPLTEQELRNGIFDWLKETNQRC